MTDTNEKYALVGRILADVLMMFARDRREEDRKQIALLQTELCQVRQAELLEIKRIQAQLPQQPFAPPKPEGEK